MLRHRTTFGPASRIMSLGTECAGEQDKFWEFHDARIRSGSGSVQGQISLAQTLGLNVPQFTACMEEQRYQNSWKKTEPPRQTNGIFTQPAFIISSGGQSVKRIGSLTAGQLGPIIDELLN